MLSKPALHLLAYLSTHQNYGVKRTDLIQGLSLSSLDYGMLLDELRADNLVHEDGDHQEVYLNLSSYRNWLVKVLPYYGALETILPDLAARSDGLVCRLQDTNHIVIVDRNHNEKYFVEKMKGLMDEYPISYEVISALDFLEEVSQVALKKGQLYLNLKVDYHEQID